MKPPPVALDAVTALPVIYHTIIPPAYEDENGHMNIRWYMAVFDDAGYPLAARLGLTPDYHAQHGTGGFDLEHHIHYLNEVLIGDAVAVYFRLFKRTAKRTHYMMFMVNETRGTLAATFECVNSFADLTVRRTAPYPDAIAQTIDALLADHKKLAWQAPICGVMDA
ncbi:MAG: thioesterase family protein [Anaerolineae bacterium]|nr:thioesterase family protein [Anaerolineae bacterium]